jgi:hypothetical protein
MQKKHALLLVFFLEATVALAHPFEYAHPLDGSRFHSCATQIIIRPGGDVDDSAMIALMQTKIVASCSGFHSFSVKVAEKNTTVIFTPDELFVPGEMVLVEFQGKYRSNLLFEIESEKSIAIPPNDWCTSEEFYGLDLKSSKQRSNFPEAIVTLEGEPGPGYIYGTTSFNPYDLFILDNTGLPVYSQNIGFLTAQNFRYLNDSLYVYASINDRFYIGLDTNFQIVDTFQCVNGLVTDFHELLMTESGNIILMSFDQQMIDMSQLVPGGDPAAIVTGLVIQEINPEDQLVFQWRSWDHFDITDGLYTGNDTIDFTSSIISYVHCNSIEIDHDQNWIISSRHMSEVTKIDRSTGDILWRLGGKNNQFEILNDPLQGFSLQHDARRTPNGTVTIFDNGVFHVPPQTRVVEYAIDEEQMTATLVWDFTNPYGDVTQVAGNAQRLENGNTFINWGKRTTVPIPNDFFLEVDSLGNHIFEMGFAVPPQMGWIYRAYRLPFPGKTISTSNKKVIQTNPTFELFPNPTSTRIHLQYISDYTGPHQIKVFAITGKEIYSNSFHASDKEPILKMISTENYLEGVYFIQLISEKGMNIIQKCFIKN